MDDTRQLLREASFDVSMSFARSRRPVRVKIIGLPTKATRMETRSSNPLCLEKNHFTKEKEAMLKPFYAKEADVPEALKGAYKKTGDRWELEVEGMMPVDDHRRQVERLEGIQGDVLSVALSMGVPTSNLRHVLSEARRAYAEGSRNPLAPSAWARLFLGGEGAGLIGESQSNEQGGADQKEKSFTGRTIKASDLGSGDVGGDMIAKLASGEVSVVPG
ncbi:MAG TPA: hypothetical protein PLB81_07455 [Deltaproteobacteria bacterium]|nr:hypothetical protein [Deltaproteobacteria bacterium]